MSNPAKAKLVTIDKPSQMPNDKLQLSAGVTALEVDFNPQTLKLTYQNKTEGGKQAKPGETQFIGSIDASLAVELTFDTTQAHGDAQAGSDVRAKTQKIFKLLIPKEKKPKSTPPLVRFEWGSFLFEGLVKSMNETLEYFSIDGIPLRSTVSLNMTTTTDLILFGEVVKKAGKADFTRATPGTEPKQPIAPNDSVQKAAGKNGDSSNWRSIAAANNIDNPLRPPTGVPLSMSGSASLSASASGGGSIGGSAGGGISAGGSIGGSIGGGAVIGGGAQAGFSAGIGGGVGFSAGASAGISAGASAGFSAGASAGVSGGISGGASFGASAGASASFGAGASANFGAGGGASLDASFGASAGISGGISGGASVGADGSFTVKKRF